MNQDQVKEKLLQIEKNVTDFKVTFSGKKSKKVDGLYKPENKEIIIHNKNFESENILMYTAIHEYAHHIQFTSAEEPISIKTHTTLFRNILHNLLVQAELAGIYYNPFKAEPEFINLTRLIKEKFFKKNGHMMKEFGNTLLKAHSLCIRHHASFNDYMNRELCFQANTAKTIMKCSSSDINPDIGFDNMKIVASIKDPGKAKQAEEAFIQGKSPDMVKMKFKTPEKPDVTIDTLIYEKKRIMTAIDRLKMKLAEVEKKIAGIK